MHVGLICEHSDPARGGAERYLHALAGRIRAHGHEVTLRARAGPWAHPVRSFPAALRPGYYARSFLPELRAAGAEVVFATVPVPGCDFYQPHNGILQSSIPPHLDALPAGVRHLRRLNPYRAVHFACLRAYQRRAVQPPATVLALSPRVLADLARFAPGARAELFRPGVDLARFTPPPAPPKHDAPHLLFVATNFRLKGLHTAIRALAHLPRARLTVVGEDRPVPADRVTYAGRVPDLERLYRTADVVVHPTHYDTASLVVLEALACGTPVVTTEADGNADLAVEGGGGALARPGDAKALAALVEETLARADRDRARAVAERFPEDGMADRVVARITCGS